MDKLSEVLKQFSISAGVFSSGNICGLSTFNELHKQEGHLHLLKQGNIRVLNASNQTVEISEPSLLFYPKPTSHSLQIEDPGGADLVCASINYGGSSNNPLANALPGFIVIPLNEDPMLAGASAWLFEEAFSEGDGKYALMNRLCELILIQLLRHMIQKGQVQKGLLAGLNHTKISKLILALHKAPANHWTLESMSVIAGMSRSKFAEEFKTVVGQTPNDYLSDWRIGIAQTLLAKGKAVSFVANEIGYEDGSALARVFRKKVGMSPKEWQKRAL